MTAPSLELLLARHARGDADVTPARISAALARAVHAHNQFATLDLGALAADVGAALASADPAGSLAILRARLVAGEPAAVTCGEYGATLQLDVLGLDASALRGPVLDVGCGAGAVLVHALRARGLDARGIDRHLDRPGPGLTEADWLELAVAPASLGTIVSHLALSLHFLHHHAARAALALRIARSYAALAAALVDGGVLAYAPGLPMLERALDPRRFAVTRVPLPAALDSAFAALGERVGEDVGYAAQVRRRA